MAERDLEAALDWADMAKKTPENYEDCLGRALIDLAAAYREEKSARERAEAMLLINAEQKNFCQEEDSEWHPRDEWWACAKHNTLVDKRWLAELQARLSRCEAALRAWEDDFRRDIASGNFVSEDRHEAMLITEKALSWRERDDGSR